MPTNCSELQSQSGPLYKTKVVSTSNNQKKSYSTITARREAKHNTSDVDGIVDAEVLGV